MATCESRFATNFIQNCYHTPKQRVLRKWYGNWGDIDWSKVIYKADSLNVVITGIALKDKKKLYEVEGEKLNFIAHEIESDEYGERFIHTDSYTMVTKSEAGLIGLEQLTKARIFSIIEGVDRGYDGKIGFRVCGFESGLKKSEDTESYNENNGSALITMTSQEGGREGTRLKTLWITDYATTLKWLEDNTNKPVAASKPPTKTSVGVALKK